MFDFKTGKDVNFDLMNSKFREKLQKIASEKSDDNWRIPNIAKTLEHKLAFLTKEKEVTGHYSLRGLLHDGEKPFLYLMPWLSQDEIRKFHRDHSAHHPDSANCTEVIHLIQMWIDWECAAMTKADKPLNAFETLVHWYPNYMDKMLPVCLAMISDEVSPKIRIRKDNALYTNNQEGEKIYKNVTNMLAEICQNLPVKLPLRPSGRLISDMKPVDIFIDALLIQEQNGDERFCMDFIRTNVNQKTDMFKAQAFFTATEYIE